jgi:hypothetical protein
MKRTILLITTTVFLWLGLSLSPPAVKNYKCLIQLTSYEGEGAYVVVSLINPEGKYEKTLRVWGDDSEWYYEMTSWWKFYGKKRANIDGITGASISGGGRSVSVIKIDPTKIDKGYKIRFETAVEDKGYHTKDVEFDLTSQNLQRKFSGKGFVRYVRFLPQ